jgi:hypothetical protein
MRIGWFERARTDLSGTACEQISSLPFGDAQRRAKIQVPLGWHTLRDSYRAWLDETVRRSGFNRKLMRHSNISTTMNVYGGTFMEAKRKANTSVVQRVPLQDRGK